MTASVLRLLPARWKAAPLARDLVICYAAPLERVRATARVLPFYLSSSGAPSAWLDWLLSLLGHPHLPGLSDARKRALVAGGVELWSRKGRVDAVLQYLRAVAGVTAQVIHTVGPAAVAGVARAGDVCGPGATAWTFEVRLPAGSIDEQELRDLLSLMVPTFTTYTVTFT